MMDLYQILGVERTASLEDIKAAYRASAKRLHPDNGGDTEAFTKVHAAYKTLSDPEKRAAYDRDGVAADFKADNDKAQAFGIIGGLFEGVLKTFLDPNIGEPEIDVIEAMRGKVRQQIADITEAIARMEGDANRLEKFADRFSAEGEGKPFLRMMVEAKVTAIRHHIPRAEHDLELQEVALEILKDQRFRFDMPHMHIALAGFPAGHIGVVR